MRQLEYRQLLTGPRFISIEALTHVSEKAGLRVFTVGDDLDPALCLLAYAIGDRLRQDGTQLAFVVGLTRILGLQEIKKIMGPRQASDMRRLDVIGVLLQRHCQNPVAKRAMTTMMATCMVPCTATTRT